MTKLPDTWRWSTLGEQCDLYQPKTISREKMMTDGSYEVYGANGVIGMYNEYNHEESEVLLSCRGNCGTVNVSKPKSWINGNAMVCRPKTSALLKSYLRYYLESFNFAKVITGTVQQQITREPLSKVEIAIPPIDEQRKIVELLEDHLSRIDAAHVDLSKARLMSSSLLASSLNTIVESVNHEYRPLSDVLEKIEAGKSFTCLGRPAEGEEWGVIKVSAMTWGQFLPNENKAASLSYNPPDSHKIKRGDILISRANTQQYVGAAVLVKSEPKRLLLSDKSLRLVPKVGFYPEWLIAVLSAPKTREAISMQSTGNEDSMRNISQKNLLNVRIPIPQDSAQQLRVVDELAVVETGITSNLQIIKSNISKIEQFRRSFLQAAFTGQLTNEVVSV